MRLSVSRNVKTKLTLEEAAMLRRIRRSTTDTTRFCAPCSQASTATDRAERRYQDHRFTPLTTLSALR